ncbi:MAG: hypothetical protein AB1634_11710 [Thermodesulfobacteriota bacterium]
MRARFLPILILSGGLMLTPAAWADELAAVVADINLRAQSDLVGTKNSLCSRFRRPVAEIDSLVMIAGSIGDVWFALRLGELTGRSPELVLREYQADKGAGWGVTAKRLGIKPGSPEFHQLKRGWSTSPGDVLVIRPGDQDRGGHDSGDKGKAKGHDKGEKGHK